MLTPIQLKKVFELRYKLVMHPKTVTCDDRHAISEFMDRLQRGWDDAERLTITYREEIRKLKLENEFLTQQLQED